MTHFPFIKIIFLAAKANQPVDHQLSRAELSHFFMVFEEGGLITLGGTENQLIGPPLTGIEYIESDWRTK